MSSNLPRWLVAVLAVALILGALLLGRSILDDPDGPAGSGSEVGEVEAPPCTEEEAKRATLETEFVDEVNSGSVPAGEGPGGSRVGFFAPKGSYRPGQLECADLDRDGLDEMVFSLRSGAGGQVLHWAVFRSDGAEWALDFYRGGFKVGVLEIDGEGTITEPSPAYEGSRHTELRYVDGELVVVEPDPKPRERRVVLSSTGVESLGALEPSTSDPAEATRVFGKPSSIADTNSELCPYHWADIGLTINFVNLGGLDPCGPDGAIGSFEIRGIAANQAGWVIGRGVEVGMTASRLRKEFPDLVETEMGLEFARVPSPFGSDGTTPLVTAEVIAGETSMYRLFVGAAGE